MSLMGTLAKVAVGVAVAKGASKILSGNTRGQTGAGGLFGGANSTNSASSGNPMDMLSDMFSGGGANAGGGLGGVLESLSGGSTASAGGLNGMLGGFAQQLQGAGGGLAGMVGGLAGNATGSNNQDFGSMLNDTFANGGVVQQAPSPDQEAVAGLMIAAMIQAAKADGNVDKEEVAKFTKDLGDIDAQEMAFIQECMEAPVDIDALVRQTPRGLGAQVYTMSVLAIDLDTRQEAQYLHDLATAYGLEHAQVNAIHDNIGVPRLYNA